jgi:uncharacterized protein YbjT (DUF2867 family)
MNIVVTGSLGHISHPLTHALVSAGHQVTVISSSPERKAAIEATGAIAAIGSVTDIAFLHQAFSGADAVYTMVPPPASYADPAFDAMAYSETVRRNYFDALKQANTLHIVNLSSWGAHRDNGTGGIVTAHYMEQQLNELPDTVSITHIRPSSFYYNLLSFIPMIRYTGRISLNYGGDDKVSMVAPVDIAAAIAAELETPGRGRNIRYVASDESTCNAIAKVLGAAIGLPDLQWVLITDEEAKNNLIAAGLSTAMAESISAIQGAIHKGYLAEDYNQHKPVLGKIKIADFAKEFAAAFNRNQ